MMLKVKKNLTIAAVSKKTMYSQLQEAHAYTWSQPIESSLQLAGGRHGHSGSCWCCSGGSTNTAAALASLRNDIFTSGNGARSGYPSIAVLLTDGVSDDQGATLREAMAVRAKGISLVVVGIGQSPNALELDGIASYPSSLNTFRATDYNSLNAIRDNLLQTVCNSKPISIKMHMAWTFLKMQDNWNCLGNLHLL